MAILEIIGGIIAIIILLFVAVIVSIPVPRHRVIRCPIRSFDKEDSEE